MLISSVTTKHITYAKRVVVLFMLLFLNIYNLKYQLYVVPAYNNLNYTPIQQIV